MVGLFKYTLGADLDTASLNDAYALNSMDQLTPFESSYLGKEPLKITVVAKQGGDIFRAYIGSDSFDFRNKVGTADVKADSGVYFSVSGMAQQVSFTGGGKADVLVGGTLSDVLKGGGGNDLLAGGAGADQINGGAGADMVSYIGSSSGVSVYLGSGMAEGGDASAGNSDATDTFYSIENAVGSSFGDTLIGGAGFTTKLQGGDGNDVMGVTQMIADNLGVELTDGGVAYEGGSGVNTVTYRYMGGAGVTADLGNSGANKGVAKGDTYMRIQNLEGTSAADKLTGDDKANMLNGDAGADILSGGTGNDTFVFNTALASTNVDHVVDFTYAAGNNDVFRLDNAVFTDLGAVGKMAPSLFKDISLAKEDGDDRIVYNSDKGALYYDGDGAGGTKPVMFAILDNHAHLTAADFVVV